MKRAIIIGSGFSSIAAACYLAKDGWMVTVLEKNEQPGGRASLLEIDGFRFDMGPSWYWMPDIFERFFADFGKKPADYYKLTKLSPAYRVIFGKDDFVDIEDSPEKIAAAFDAKEPGAGAQMLTFLDSAKKNYDVAMRDLVYRPGLSLTELVSLRTVARLKLFFTTISKTVRGRIRHPHLRSILEFPVLFLGAKPGNTPAFYSFMNYADFGLGTWYPEGGFHAVAMGMVQLARELNVQFCTSEEVTGFEYENNTVKAVRTGKNIYPCDAVISGADYAHTDHLLNECRNYPEGYWQKKTFAPSALLYYVAFDRKINKLLHHNLFFDTDFKAHAEEIYDRRVFPQKPLFYANFSSKTDKTTAPEGNESGFFLIPVAVDLDDNAAIHEKYFEVIMQRIEACTGQNLRDHVLFKRSFGVNDFKDRYHSCRGNAYGLANTLRQTSVLRPSVKNRHLINFYYTGQLTVPGPGVPPALISGKIAADLAIKNINGNPQKTK